VTTIEKLKQYPLALWTLALYLCSLGFNLKYDIPLVFFALSLSYFFLHTHINMNMSFVKRHWHVIFFGIGTVIVTLASTDVAYSAMAQVQFMPSLMIYIAIVTVVQNPSQLRFIYVSVVFVTLLIAITLLWQITTAESTDMMIKLKESRNPLFIVPNDVLFLVALSPIALAMAIFERHWTFKLLAISCLAGVGVASIYIESRQASAIYAFTMFAFFFLWRPLWGVVIGLTALALVFCIDALLGGGLVKKLFLFPRAYIWQSAWEMFLDSPITGKGPGHFKHFYYEFLDKAGYGAGLVEDRRLMNWAHSLYFEQLAERGIIGMVALLVLVSRPLWNLGRRMQAFKSTAGSKYGQFVTENPYTIGLVVSYSAFLLGGIAETSLLRLWGATLLFLLTALACIEIYRIKNDFYSTKNCF
jgi:O-antigen ligase